MGSMAELAQPLLVALLVLLVPASVRWGVKTLSTKLDEGRVIAEARALDAKKVADERHVENTLRLDRIETQTTTTNGKVAEHVSLLDALDKRLVREEAKTELLTEIYLGRQPDKGL